MAVAGVVMAAAGGFDPLGVHGVFVLVFSGGLLYLVLSSFYDPEPTETAWPAIMTTPRSARAYPATSRCVATGASNWRRSGPATAVCCPPI